MTYKEFKKRAGCSAAPADDDLVVLPAMKADYMTAYTKQKPTKAPVPGDEDVIAQLHAAFSQDPSKRQNITQHLTERLANQYGETPYSVSDSIVNKIGELSKRYLDNYYNKAKYIPQGGATKK